MKFFKLQIRNGETGENFVEECIKDNRITTSIEYGKEFVEVVRPGDIVLVHSGKRPDYLVKVLHEITDRGEINGESFGKDYRVEILSDYTEEIKNKLFNGRFKLGPNGTFTHLKKPSQTRDNIIKWFEYVTGLKVNLNKMNKVVTSVPSKNQIFFGPPGTGKTYSTISESLKICGVEIDKLTRAEIRSKYDELVKEGRIVFSTFHQSMSYEDFIEGIKPEVTEEGEVTYRVQDGLFKQLSYKSLLSYHGSESKVNKQIAYFDELFELYFENLESQLTQLEENDKLLLPLRSPGYFTEVLSLNEKENYILTKGTRSDNNARIYKDKLWLLFEAFNSIDDIKDVTVDIRSVGKGLGWSSNYYGVFQDLKKFESTVSIDSSRGVRTKEYTEIKEYLKGGLR